MKLDVEYGQGGAPSPQAQLLWAPVNDAPDPAAMNAAQEADVVVAVVGITSRLEGEEMKSTSPAFWAATAPVSTCPSPEEDLVQALAATHKPLIVVLMNGSALGVNWEKAHAQAILESWYAGEEGGAAIAQTLSGKNNPAGRLPVTFYKDVQQLPVFRRLLDAGTHLSVLPGRAAVAIRLWAELYDVPVRRHDGTPGARSMQAMPLNVAATVTNAGALAGDEVVQLYLKFPDTRRCTRCGRCAAFNASIWRRRPVSRSNFTCSRAI